MCQMRNIPFRVNNNQFLCFSFFFSSFYFRSPAKNEALLAIAAIATIAKATGAKILIIFLPFEINTNNYFELSDALRRLSVLLLFFVILNVFQTRCKGTAIYLLSPRKVRFITSKCQFS